MIGAWLDDDNGTDSGSVYVFRRDGTTWVQEQKLVAKDGAAGDWFGLGVAISGNVATVGARQDDDNGTSSGSVYVFRYGGMGWTQEQKLLASDSAAGDLFGVSVAIDGEVAVIGSEGNDDNGSSSGSAYVFRHDGTTWVEEQKVLPADGAAGDLFGNWVAIGGDVAVVAAYNDDDLGANSGSAYVFRYNETWTEEQKLAASDGAAGDQFGYSIGIDDQTVIVGARLDDDNGMDSGSVYLFRYDGTTWVDEKKLLATDGAGGDWLGYSAAIDGNVALVGANHQDDGGANAGTAYVFMGDCEQVCPWDCGDGGGSVGVVDLLAILAQWGQVGLPCDVDGGGVGVTDLLALLANWGACP